MIPFNIETFNSDKSPPLSTSYVTCDVAVVTFKNLLNMAVWEECLNKTAI